MSFDLVIWKASAEITTEKANKIYNELCEGIEDNQDIAEYHSCKEFLHELFEKFPRQEDWPDDDIDDCPWSSHDIGEKSVIICLGWSFVESVAPIVIDLTRKYKLTCYDPQNNELY